MSSLPKSIQFIAVLMFMVVVEAASAQDGGRRPNILLIYVDDMVQNER